MFELSTVIRTAFIAILIPVTLVLIKFVQHVIQYLRKLYYINQFPSERHHWFWGNLFQFPGLDDEGLKFQREVTEKFPRTVSLRFGPFFVALFAHHPETVKTILKTSEPKGSAVYNLIKPWVGDGLLLSSGQKWARNRRLLTPAFHFDILKPYLDVKNEATDIFLNKIKSFEGQSFEVSSLINTYTLDIILRCAFSYNSDCQVRGEKHPYVEAVIELGRLTSERFFKPWVHSDFWYFLTPDGKTYREKSDYVHSVAEEIIAKRKETIDLEKLETKKSTRCLDFLDTLLTARDDAGEGLSDSEIRDEVDTFLFEGHDTTASALMWTLYSLAEHPDIQRKVQREVDDLLKGRATDWVHWEDLKEMKYTTMCIKEAMRLHVPVPFIAREISQDMEIDGLKVAKGTIILMVIYQIHHNPEVWEQSMEFLPDRFSPENIDSRDSYAFIPFSAGPRNCIGQNFAMHELKLAVARILHRFDLELDPDFKVEKRESIVMKAAAGIQMKAKLRQVSP